MRVVVATLALALAPLFIAVPAVADTEGAIVIGVDIQPLRPGTSPANLAASGGNVSPGLLLAVALAATGSAAVVISRRRAPRAD